MADFIDKDTKIELYKIIIKRYQNTINENESHSVSEIRQRTSPYSDFIRSLKAKLLCDLPNYDHKKDFLTAVHLAISYIASIHTCEFAFTFWMAFEDIERLKIATVTDKSILFVALLRSFESEDAVVVMTTKGRAVVNFAWAGNNYIFVPETGSLVVGEDSTKIFSDDPPAYSFNDLKYENYDK